MEARLDTASRRIHPLIIVAAASVTLFSLTGVAALTGFLPKSAGSELAAIAAAEPKAAGSKPVETQPAAARANPAPAPRPAQPRPVVQTPPQVVARAQAPVETIPPIIQGGPVPPVSQPSPPAQSPVAQQSTPVYRPCHDCGVVESVRQVAVAGQGTGAGAVIGGAAGGVLGHQVGNGRGQDVATVLGAIGGAIAGHQIERHARRSEMYEIEVRMEDGSVRTFQQADPPGWRQGEPVRVTNNGLARAS